MLALEATQGISIATELCLHTVVRKDRCFSVLFQELSGGGGVTSIGGCTGCARKKRGKTGMFFRGGRGKDINITEDGKNGIQIAMIRV